MYGVISIFSDVIILAGDLIPILSVFVICDGLSVRELYQHPLNINRWC